MPHKVEDRSKFWAFRNQDIFEMVQYVLVMWFINWAIFTHALVKDYSKANLYRLIATSLRTTAILIVWCFGRRYRKQFAYMMLASFVIVEILNVW